MFHLQVSVLASGSKGNATFVAIDGAKILVDAGISATRIKKALAAENVDAADLDAVLLTHEHRDHVAGLATLAKWYHLPIYSRRKTLASLPISIQQAIADAGSTETLFPEDAVAEEAAPYGAPSSLLHAASGTFRLAGLRITPFSTSHDAADPVGWRLSGSRTVAVCTDLGFVTQTVEAAIDGTDVLVLEANHDPAVLQGGRYPWPLKRRILSNRGHLANADAAWAIARMQHRPKDVFLAHLSQENNTPDLAYETVSGILKKQGIDVPLHVARQDEAVRLN